MEAALNKRGRFHTICDNPQVKKSIVVDGEARKRYVIAYTLEKLNLIDIKEIRLPKRLSRRWRIKKSCPMTPTINSHPRC